MMIDELTIDPSLLSSSLPSLMVAPPITCPLEFAMSSSAVVMSCTWMATWYKHESRVYLMPNVPYLSIDTTKDPPTILFGEHFSSVPTIQKTSIVSSLWSKVKSGSVDLLNAFARAGIKPLTQASSTQSDTSSCYIRQVLILEPSWLVLFLDYRVIVVNLIHIDVLITIKLPIKGRFSRSPSTITRCFIDQGGVDENDSCPYIQFIYQGDDGETHKFVMIYASLENGSILDWGFIELINGGKFSTLIDYDLNTGQSLILDHDQDTKWLRVIQSTIQDLLLIEQSGLSLTSKRKGKKNEAGYFNAFFAEEKKAKKKKGKFEEKSASDRGDTISVLIDLTHTEDSLQFEMRGQWSRLIQGLIVQGERYEPWYEDHLNNHHNFFVPVNSHVCSCIIDIKTGHVMPVPPCHLILNCDAFIGGRAGDPSTTTLVSIEGDQLILMDMTGATLEQFKLAFKAHLRAIAFNGPMVDLLLSIDNSLTLVRHSRRQPLLQSDQDSVLLPRYWDILGPCPYDDPTQLQVNEGPLLFNLLNPIKSYPPVAKVTPTNSGSPSAGWPGLVSWIESQPTLVVLYIIFDSHGPYTTQSRISAKLFALDKAIDRIMQTLVEVYWLADHGHVMEACRVLCKERVPEPLLPENAILALVYRLVNQEKTILRLATLYPGHLGSDALVNRIRLTYRIYESKSCPIDSLVWYLLKEDESEEEKALNYTYFLWLPPCPSVIRAIRHVLSNIQESERALRLLLFGLYLCWHLALDYDAQLLDPVYGIPKWLLEHPRVKLFISWTSDDKILTKVSQKDERIQEQDALIEINQSLLLIPQSSPKLDLEDFRLTSPTSIVKAKNTSPRSTTRQKKRARLHLHQIDSSIKSDQLLNTSSIPSLNIMSSPYAAKKPSSLRKAMTLANAKQATGSHSATTEGEDEEKEFTPVRSLEETLMRTKAEVEMASAELARELANQSFIPDKAELYKEVVQRDDNLPSIQEEAHKPSTDFMFLDNESIDPMFAWSTFFHSQTKEGIDQDSHILDKIPETPINNQRHFHADSQAKSLTELDAGILNATTPIEEHETHETITDAASATIQPSGKYSFRHSTMKHEPMQYNVHRLTKAQLTPVKGKKDEIDKEPETASVINRSSPPIFQQLSDSSLVKSKNYPTPTVTLGKRNFSSIKAAAQKTEKAGQGKSGFKQLPIVDQNVKILSAHNKTGQFKVSQLRTSPRKTKPRFSSFITESELNRIPIKQSELISANEHFLETPKGSKVTRNSGFKVSKRRMTTPIRVSERVKNK